MSEKKDHNQNSREEELKQAEEAGSSSKHANHEDDHNDDIREQGQVQEQEPSSGQAATKSNLDEAIRRHEQIEKANRKQDPSRNEATNADRAEAEFERGTETKAEAGSEAETKERGTKVETGTGTESEAEYTKSDSQDTDHFKPLSVKKQETEAHSTAAEKSSEDDIKDETSIYEGVPEAGTRVETGMGKEEEMEVDPGSGPGAKAEADPETGMEPESEPGAVAGTEVGTDSETGTETGTDPETTGPSRMLNKRSAKFSDEEKANSEESKEAKRKNRKKNKKGRIRLIPIWIRLFLLVLVLATSLIAGAMIGYGIVGDGGNPRDVLESETWYQIYDMIFEDTERERQQNQ